MKKIRLEDVVSFSKGQQINGDELMKKGRYDYLNGGVNPSGCWNDFNVTGDTVTVSEGGNSCGYVNYMSYPFWCGAHCYYLYDSKLNNKYLYYALKSQQEKIMKLRTGACMPNIKKTDLGKFELYITTDINAQELTVFILDKITDLIDKRKKQLEKLDELVKSRFVEMFGDPKENPKGYSKRQLKQTCKVITGNTPSRAVCEYYGEHIEWIKTDNIVSGLINPTTATEFLSEKGMAVGRTVEKDSILMACIAGSLSSIGRVCVTDRKVAFNQQINAIVPNDYNILFLYVLLQISKEYLVEEINMALKSILSKSKLEEKVFIVPPIELQEEFAAFVKQTDKSKFEIKQSLEKLELLKKALMQKYFG